MNILFIRIYYVLSIAKHGIHPYAWILYSPKIRLNKIKITELIVTEMLEEAKTRELHFWKHSKISKFKIRPHEAP